MNRKNVGFRCPSFKHEIASRTGACQDEGWLGWLPDPAAVTSEAFSLVCRLGKIAGVWKRGRMQTVEKQTKREGSRKVRRGVQGRQGKTHFCYLLRQTKHSFLPHPSLHPTFLGNSFLDTLTATTSSTTLDTQTNKQTNDHAFFIQLRIRHG